MTYRCSQTVSALNGITDLQVDAHCALINRLKLMANCRYGGAAIDMTRNAGCKLDRCSFRVLDRYMYPQPLLHRNPRSNSRPASRGSLAVVGRPVKALATPFHGYVLSGRVRNASSPGRHLGTCSKCTKRRHMPHPKAR